MENIYIKRSFLLVFFLLPFTCNQNKLKQRGVWYNMLPNCPCQNPDQEGIKLEDGWAKDKGSITTYHSGADECFRSYPPVLTSEGQSGQQCCYDARGKLITGGSGAGTPDKVSTCSSENDQGVMNTRLIGIIGHYQKDVKPWNQLGGINKAWKEYNKHWVPNNGNSCVTNLLSL